MIAHTLTYTRFSDCMVAVADGSIVFPAVSTPRTLIGSDSSFSGKSSSLLFAVAILAGRTIGETN